MAKHRFFIQADRGFTAAHVESFLASGYELRIVGADAVRDRIEVEASGSAIVDDGEGDPWLEQRIDEKGVKTFFISWNRGNTYTPFNFKKVA